MAYLDFQLNEPPDRQRQYREVLRLHSIRLGKSVAFLQRALQLMIAVPKSELLYHGVLFLLGRHVAEQIDAASVLVAEGCILPCKPLLRSAFEARLGVEYILELDCERRAIAYQVKGIPAATASRWIKKHLRAWAGRVFIGRGCYRQALFGTDRTWRPARILPEGN